MTSTNYFVFAGCNFKLNIKLKIYNYLIKIFYQHIYMYNCNNIDKKVATYIKNKIIY